MMRRLITLAIITTGLALAEGSLGQSLPQQKSTPEPQDVIRVYTDLVQTDVTVVDKQGRFVNNLKREDFQLRVDGKPQPIEFSELVAAGSANEEAQLSAARGVSQATAGAQSLPLDRGRTILFFIDDFHLAAGDLTYVRKALLRFIDNDLGQNDEAAIASASGEIGFLQQLTDNKFVLRRAVERIAARPYSVRDPGRPPMTEYQALAIDQYPMAMSPANVDRNSVFGFFIAKEIEETQTDFETAAISVRNRARIIVQQAANITTNTLSGFESLVHSSTQLPGRKLVFFISDGFFVDPRNSDSHQRLDKITHAAAQNAIVIYSLDARGLTTGAPEAGEEVAIDPTGALSREQTNALPASRDGMTKLANDTGGKTIFDTNALNVGLTKGLSETAVYYLLGWRANHEDQDLRNQHHLDVTVSGRAGAIVRLRPISLAGGAAAAAKDNAPSDQKAEARKPPAVKLREAIGRMLRATELPIALDLHYTNTAKGPLLTINVEGEIDALSFGTIDGKEKAIVDLSGTIYDEKGKAGANFTQQATIMPAAEDVARVRGKVFNYKHQVLLSPGLYQVRAAARDAQSGKIGSAYDWILIPDLSTRELTMSSIVAGELSTAAAAGGQQQGSRIISRADHRFDRDASLWFLVHVYNASVAPPDGKPDLALQVQILRNRQPVITTPTQPMRPTPNQPAGELSPGGTLSLAGLSRGRYLLLVTAIDRVAKTSASQQMRFQID
jgi:VWFA-related protein